MNRLGKYLDQLTQISEEKLSLLDKLVNQSKKIVILGNGGSNAIATHYAQDYTKVLKIPCISFSDPIRMSCYANDYGWDNAYKIFLEEYSDNETLVILISSSGESKNIINCSKYCEEIGLSYILLSGFGIENTLHKNFSKNSQLSFCIDSKDYGVIEMSHDIILHSLV